MALLTAAVVFLTSYTVSPLAGVRVEGTRMYPAADVWEAVPDRASLLTLNTATVEQRIESNPWVEGATVTREWDSGIVAVQVEERAALVNAEMDGRRVISALDGTELPGLGGADLNSVGLDGDQLEDILETGRVLENNKVAIDSVDRSDAGGVEATVDGRRVIFAGVVREAQAKALRGLMERYPDAERFDLRSSDRVVVVGVEGSGGNGDGSEGERDG